MKVVLQHYTALFLGLSNYTWDILHGRDVLLFSPWHSVSKSEIKVYSFYLLFLVMNFLASRGS